MADDAGVVADRIVSQLAGDPEALRIVARLVELLVQRRANSGVPELVEEKTSKPLSAT